MNELMTGPLLAEYKNTVTDLGAEATDEQIVRALVERGEWTERGAREVINLARQYGTSILRNALALAAAMKIEDGNVGL
jgi:acyl-CoA reductase-like NAD-dependent aldehyde dehydrogenase